MRKRLVNTDHHNDERFFDLSRDARYIYGHLLTHPQMTSFGLIRLTVGGLADECGLERDECEAALEQLAGVGRVEADRLCLALDEDYLEVPANPSVVTGWGKILDLLPRTVLVQRRLSLAAERVKQRARDAGEKGTGWTDAIPENLRERLSTPVTTSTAPVSKPAPKRPVRAPARVATVKPFPVAVTVGRAEPTTPGPVSTTTTSTLASAVYVTASGPAPLTLTSTAPLLVDPETIEVEPATYEIEDDSGDVLDAADLFALVDPPQVEEPIEVEAIPEPAAPGLGESPYTLPVFGLFPPPAPPILPSLSELANPDFAETSGKGVEDGVGHGVEHHAEHGVGHGVEHGVGHGAGHPVPHGVEDGAGHPAEHLAQHGVEHRVGDGVAHSIFHLPVSRLHHPREAGLLRRAPARGQAREAGGGDGSQVELEFEFEVEDTDGTIIELPDDIPVVEYFEDPDPPPAMVPTELEPEPSFWPEPDPESESEPGEDPEADPDPDPDPWPGAEPEASSDPDPAPWPEPEPDPDPETDQEPETEPTPKPVSETGSEPDLDPAPEPDPDNLDPAAIDLDPDTEADYQELLAKAEGVLGRTLEVEELGMLRTWCRDIPHRLIESAIADGMRAQIRRLAWVGKRLETLVAGHLAKHPELADDDLAEEQADALAVLANDRLSGHLSETTRKLASAAVRKATTARRVRDILDQALES